MEGREFQLTYKGNRCAHCGMSVLESVQRYGTFNRMYQFNHVDPSKKSPEYDNLIRQKISTTQLEELDKCVLLCNQCHGTLHGQNINTTMTITIDVEGQIAEQTFSGQVIFDKIDNRLAFFTGDEILITPYWLNLGVDPVRVIFGKDLKHTLMPHWVPLTRDRGPLAITDEHHHLLFGAVRIDDEFVEILQHCTFSLVPIHGDFTPEMSAWIRNGLALVRDGNDVVIRNNVSMTMQVAYSELLPK